MRNPEPLRLSAGPVRAAAALLAISLFASTLGAQSLRGSKPSMDRQNRQARAHNFSFLETPSQLADFVERGLLVRLTGNSDYELKEVSYPYARPEVKLFVERLASQYMVRCREPLVVTSLTRPRRRQPANASSTSVHPTGMALDLRRSWSRRCRAWLEGAFLTLEEKGVLEATLERSPYHYHLAIFPGPYKAYVEEIGGRPEGEFVVTAYRVSRGDTLWKIASRHNTTVEHVKRQNGLRTDRIFIGQVLQIPSAE